MRDGGKDAGAWRGAASTLIEIPTVSKAMGRIVGRCNNDDPACETPKTCGPHAAHL